MYDVEEINDLDSLARRKDLWQALAGQTSGATFFHTFDWLEVFWRHYGADRKLRALVVSRGGEPVGILPLVVQREPRKVGVVRILTYPLNDWGSFFGPLGPDPTTTLAEGLRYIGQTRRDWDLVELRWIERGGPLDQVSRQALAQNGWQAYERVRGQTSLVRLGCDWNTYFTGISKSFREKHRRYERRLAAEGEVTYVSYRPRGAAAGDNDPRWDLYDTCEAIAAKSWQGASENGTTLSHESVRPFLRDVHTVAARAGALDMHLMYLSGRPLAFAYNYFWKGAVFGLRIGYDAELSKNGVGNHMTIHAIKHSCEQGDTLYDMGPGSLDYKRVFATQVVDILQYTHYHPLAPRAQALRLNHALTQFWPQAGAPATPAE